MEDNNTKNISDTDKFSLQEKYDKVMEAIPHTEITAGYDNKLYLMFLGDCIQYMHNAGLAVGSDYFPSMGSGGYKEGIFDKLYYELRPKDSYNLPIEPTEKRRPVIEYLLSIIPS